MFCPHCGAQITSEQKFCRRCGADLRLAGHTTGSQIPEYRPAYGAEPSRFQILVDVIHESLQKGVEQLKLEIHRLQVGDKQGQIMKLGFWAFWAALSAVLLGRGNGLILLILSLGAMAYARGFFRSTKSQTEQRERAAMADRQTQYARSETGGRAYQQPVSVKPKTETITVVPSVTEDATVKLDGPEYPPPNREAER
jgi:hypothetical protein